MKTLATLFTLLLIWSCGGSQRPSGSTGASAVDHSADNPAASPQVPGGESPPASAPYKDAQFPWIERSSTSHGLELNTVAVGSLPVIDIRLVVRSGRADDPDDKIGTAQLAVDMLKEGTKRSSSEDFARRVDQLGAHFNVGCSDDAAFISIHALEDHLDEALALLAEVIASPRFDAQEFQKLKSREADRLAMDLQDPTYLATRAFYKTLYAGHPYANTDINPKALKTISLSDVKSWHAKFVTPANSTMVIASRKKHAELAQRVEKALTQWKGASQKTVTDGSAKPVPTSNATKNGKRRVILVNRPGSVQSIIVIGNLAMPRTSKDFVPFTVSNQVLGGSAASRLFLDLRERRSLTYGAYSGLITRLNVAPFKAQAAVRTQVTVEALDAFFEHLDKITHVAAAPEEFKAAQRYLADSFPLRMDTSAEIAAMVSELRTYRLPDDTWDHYRSDILKVTPAEGLALAQRYIHPGEALVVVVGEASQLKGPLSKFGEVEEVSPKDLL